MILHVLLSTAVVVAFVLAGFECARYSTAQLRVCAPCCGAMQSKMYNVFQLGLVRTSDSGVPVVLYAVSFTQTRRFSFYGRPVRGAQLERLKNPQASRKSMA